MGYSDIQNMIELSKLIETGNKYFDKGLFIDALELYSEAWKSKEDMSSDNERGDISLKISQCYLYLSNDFENAKKYANIAIDTHSKINDNVNAANDYMHLGLIYSENKHKDESEKAFNEALKIGEKTDNKSIVAEVYNNLGLLHWKNKKKALQCFLTASKISQEASDITNAVLSFENLGYLSKENGNVKEALEYFLTGVEIIESTAKNIKSKDSRNEFKLSYKDIYDDAVSAAMGLSDVDFAMSIASKLKDGKK